MARTAQAARKPAPTPPGATRRASPPPAGSAAPSGCAYWETLYQSGNTPWEKGAPSPGLVDFLKAHRRLKPGTVAVPGCGTGHDVRVWARAGFAAYGFDLAPRAIRLAAARTRAAKLRATFRRSDFLRDDPPFLFDWLFEHTLFCAILPAERDAYVRAVARWLKPGGCYLSVNYLIPDRDGPPFGVTRRELRRRFAPGFELLADWVPRSYPNRTGLERMFWWRRTSGPG
jgi:methyl halide transferase